MRCLARTSLGLLGLALIAPTGVGAQDVSSSAPAGYQAAALAADPTPPGFDGKPTPTPSDPAPASALARAAVPQPVDPPVAAKPAAPQPAFHVHNGRTLCARCAAKEAQARASMNAKPPGKIVGCAHSRNGVCTACQAALSQPGEFITMGGPAPVAEAPGRAVASKGPSPSAAHVASRPGRASASAPAPFDGVEGDPAPVGVVQANYSPAAPSGMPASYAAMAPQQPGRAVAESGAGHDPYQKKSGSFPHPHIIGHVLGWSGLGGEWADEKARRKAEAHAMISYENNVAGPAPVEELPASAVFAKKRWW